MIAITAFQICTLVLGSVAAILGVYHVWRDRQRRKTRVRVIPGVARPVNAGEPLPERLSIEIVNLSNYRVTVKEVGFHPARGPGRLCIWPLSSIGFPVEEWPTRLEPRDSITVYASPDLKEDYRATLIRRAYVRTACGHEFSGTSPALQQYVFECVSK